jgi:Tfp pilus assembly protein PilO
VSRVDEPRYLGPALGYVASSTAAMDKLEAVSEAEQERQTLRARRAERERQLAAWREAHATITNALAAFRRSGPIDPGVASAVRAVERSAEAVSQKLG